MRASLLMLLLGAGILPAATPCDNPPELADFVRMLPANGAAKRAAIEERLKKNPDNFTLNRVFLDSSVYEKASVRERYQKLWESHRDSLDYAYLRGRSLVGSNTKEALRLYAEILAQDPNYPWVHLSQLEIYRSEVFRDRKALQASFTAVTSVCPSLFEPYQYLNEIPDKDVVAAAAQRLRAMLEHSEEPRELAFFASLWAAESTVEFRADNADERQTIEADVQRLLPFENNARMRSVIETGAKLTGDTALEKRMRQMRKPNAMSAVIDASNPWYRQHPRPKNDDSPEKKMAYGGELLAKSDEWMKMAPNDVIAYSARVHALIFMRAPAEQIAHAGDELLAVINGDHLAGASWMVSLAQAYVDGGVLLDRVPALIAAAIQVLDDPEAIIEIDLTPPSKHTAENRARNVYDRDDALLVLAQMYEKLGDKDRTYQTLWQANDYLASKASLFEGVEDQMRDWYDIARYENRRTQAEIAEREGNKLDALNGYREALRVRPMARDELLSRQRKLWKELGGSDEGWQQWIEDEPPPNKAKSGKQGPMDAPFERRKLPPLSARDIHGTEWTLDRFAGKKVIAVVWATWCEPCRAELPSFSKLAERLKSSGDMLALSFNTDDNAALAESFAKSQNYTFPILSAKQYAEDLMTEFSIPRTWIIEDGYIIEEHVGFGPAWGKWIEKILPTLK